MSDDLERLERRVAQLEALVRQLVAQAGFALALISLAVAYAYNRKASNQSV
ncbi:MAG: hypothetical protein ACREMJ_01840 [Gemmatimonadales bacterium]